MAKGWIQKRGDKFRLFVSDGYNPDGSRRVFNKSIKAQNQTEAEKELRKYMTAVEEGRVSLDGNMTLEQFIERWIRDYAETNLAPKTLHRYKQLVVRIKEGLGRSKLAKLQPLQISQFIRSLQDTGIRRDGKKGTLSPLTIRHYFRLLSKILQTAFTWNLIPENPCKRLQQPKVEESQIEIADNDQLRDILDKLRQQPLLFQASVWIALATGARRGEYVALNWSDIDLATGSVRIDKNWQYIPGQGCFMKDPKTRSSRRTVTIPKSICPLLESYREEQAKIRALLGSKWMGTEDAVFTTATGRRIHPDWLTKKWASFLKTNGIGHVQLRSLRNTNTTLLTHANEDIKTISARLGHSRTSTTLNIYTHVVKGADQAAANKLKRIFDTLTSTEATDE